MYKFGKSQLIDGIDLSLNSQEIYKLSNTARIRMCSFKFLSAAGIILTVCNLAEAYNAHLVSYSLTKQQPKPYMTDLPS